jgi:hypothetical protein
MLRRLWLRFLVAAFIFSFLLMVAALTGVLDRG